jgi:coenzyme F420-0:L-glutamate ligase / coenzyme F420-1:gamma-L-glutamate ligase
MTRAATELSLVPVTAKEEIEPGTKLDRFLIETLRRAEVELAAGDVLVVPQKIVSKAEGRVVRLDSVTPSAFAKDLAEATSNEPRFAELVLRESRKIVRTTHDQIIAETHHGFICANAGVDRWNVPEGCASLLPVDPDRSAVELRRSLETHVAGPCGVIISDTFGRAWRMGSVDVAIGVSGVAPLIELRASPDRNGRPDVFAEPAVADELAAAAGLVMGPGDGVVAVRIRGAAAKIGDGRARDLNRPEPVDPFR